MKMKKIFLLIIGFAALQGAMLNGRVSDAKAYKVSEVKAYKQGKACMSLTNAAERQKCLVDAQKACDALKTSDPLKTKKKQDDCYANRVFGYMSNERISAEEAFEADFDAGEGQDKQ